MFAENSSHYKTWPGSIEIITGCMFSGKTEELIRRLKRALIARQKVGIFKSALDKRYSEENVVSHDGKVIESIPVEHPEYILKAGFQFEVIGIDEAQFFDHSLPEVCTYLANQGKRIIIAGLDLDFRGKPFGPMPELMACAEFTTKLHAICLHCGNLAQFSFRSDTSESQVMVGSNEIYKPLCRRCFQEAKKS
jgi:thymidine kinase